VQRLLTPILLSLALAAVGSAQAEATSELGRKVFVQIAQPPCAICHTLKDAESIGEIGPALDDLKPDAARVAAAVRNGVGVMPPYEGKLTDEQIEAVAAYVAQATGAAK
jgi:Cytochrome c.